MDRASALESKQKPLPGTTGVEGTGLAGSALDDLKFRIVRRGQLHYFQDVRFHDSEEGQVVTRFLEGHALEHLTPQMLQNVFGPSAIAIPMQSLVRDLQRLFC